MTSPQRGSVVLSSNVLKGQHANNNAIAKALTQLTPFIDGDEDFHSPVDPLECVHFGHCLIGSSAAAALALILNNHRSLAELRLENLPNPLNTAIWASFFHAAVACARKDSCLETVVLDRCKLKDREVESIMDCFSHGRSYDECDVEGVGGGSSGSMSSGDDSEESSDSDIEVGGEKEVHKHATLLGLRGNKDASELEKRRQRRRGGKQQAADSSSPGAVAVAMHFGAFNQAPPKEIRARAMPPLMRVQLSGNAIGDAGAQSIASSLLLSSGRRRRSSSSQCGSGREASSADGGCLCGGGLLSTLRELVLEDNRIGDAGAIALGDALARTCPRASARGEVDSDGSDDGGSSSGSGGSGSVRRCALCESSTFELEARRKGWGLEVLLLGGNRVGPLGAAALASALVPGALSALRMEALSLKSNRIGARGAASFAEALAAASTPPKPPAARSADGARGCSGTDSSKSGSAGVGGGGGTGTGGSKDKGKASDDAKADAEVMLKFLDLRDNNLGSLGHGLLTPPAKRHPTLRLLLLQGNGVGACPCAACLEDHASEEASSESMSAFAFGLGTWSRKKNSREGGRGTALPTPPKPSPLVLGEGQQEEDAVTDSRAPFVVVSDRVAPRLKRPSEPHPAQPPNAHDDASSAAFKEVGDSGSKNTKGPSLSSPRGFRAKFEHALKGGGGLPEPKGPSTAGSESESDDGEYGGDTPLTHSSNEDFKNSAKGNEKSGSGLISGGVGGGGILAPPPAGSPAYRSKALKAAAARRRPAAAALKNGT